MGYEINFDGIVGPSHNYSGLSYGNIPSMTNQLLASNPREAALQGLEKMHTLMELGIKQAVLPPQERPHIPTFRRLGFIGTDKTILKDVENESPELLRACSSAASMWTANAATMCPSADSADKKVHFTPANLSNKFHRSIEAPTTTNILKAIFSNEKYFTVHPELPQGNYFSDEGAANHSRFCREYSEPGVHLFVFGRYAFRENDIQPKRFPARQTFEASMAIARMHGINSDQMIVAQQNPEVIDAGVFHNDVISVGNQNVFFYHEKAFINTSAIIEEIQEKYEKYCKGNMHFIKVRNEQLSLPEVVSSYLFNSQIVTLSDGTMVLIAPAECEEIDSVHNFLKKLISSGKTPINEVRFFNLRQSMMNGGGPACLRFRVVLTDKELMAMNQHVLLTEELYKKLQRWIKKYYRDRLILQDLGDPSFLKESRNALEELTEILHLGPIYNFQRS